MIGVHATIYSLDSFVLHADAFRGYHIAEEPYLVLMKSTPLQVGI